jgi:hypothetical protein
VSDRLLMNEDSIHGTVACIFHYCLRIVVLQNSDVMSVKMPGLKVNGFVSKPSHARTFFF